MTQLHTPVILGTKQRKSCFQFTKQLFVYIYFSSTDYRYLTNQTSDAFQMVGGLKTESQKGHSRPAGKQSSERVRLANENVSVGKTSASRILIPRLSLIRTTKTSQRNAVDLQVMLDRKSQLPVNRPKSNKSSERILSRVWAL